MAGKSQPRYHGKTPEGRRSRATTKITPEQLEAINEELKLLPGLIRTHYTKWTDGAKDFQLECMGGQKLGKEILLHAATGAGKTGIAAGPHLLPSSQGKVTLMVSPLLSLHDEQVCLSFFFSFFFGGISRLTCICRLLRSRTNLGSRPLRLTAPMAGVQRISCR